MPRRITPTPNRSRAGGSRSSRPRQINGTDAQTRRGRHTGAGWPRPQVALPREREFRAHARDLVDPPHPRHRVNAGADEPTLETDDQKTLCALGLINRSLSPFNLSPSELELVEAGLADGSLHKTPKVDLETYGPKIKQFQEARAAAVAAAEKRTSQVVVDQAAREPGATRTASGLVMIPITPGTGASPKGTDTVTVNYEGRLTDGGL
jgi:hypothetical protein